MNRAVSVHRLLLLVFVVALVVTPRSALAAGGGPIGGWLTIADASNDQLNAALAYNTQRGEYLVVWQNEWDGGTKFNIAGQRVAGDGSLVGGPFNIYGGDNGHSPDVAYDSQNDAYLVVWVQDELFGPEVHSARVSATGTPGNYETIASSSNLADHSDPAVAYASTEDRYLVVWSEHWQPTPLQYDILGQVVKSDGTLDGGHFTIGDDPGNNSYCKKPALAYNRRRNEYLVAWQQRDPISGETDIYARRVTGGGVALQPSSIALTTLGGDDTVPAVGAIPIDAAAEGHYLVVWEREFPANDFDILGRHLDGKGNVDGTYVFVNTTTEDSYTPSVSGSESGESFLVTWEHLVSSGSGQIIFVVDNVVGQAFGPDGTAQGEMQSMSALSKGRPDVAAGANGEFLVAFDDTLLTGDAAVGGHLWGNRIYLPLVVRN